MSAVLPSILSAIAATIAAALAGLTLYVTGRRDHLHWIRESLVDSYEKYLTASFEAPAHRGRQARLCGIEGQDLDEYRTQAAEAHHRQTDALTKLRMIAPATVVAAAEAALDGPDVPDDDLWAQLRAM